MMLKHRSNDKEMKKIQTGNRSLINLFQIYIKKSLPTDPNFENNAIGNTHFFFGLKVFLNKGLIRTQHLSLPRGGLAVIVNKINNLATQIWKKILAFAS
jgi:hypothetical protein